MSNPFRDSTKKMKRAESNEGLDLAVVEQVDDDENHIVFVRVLSATSEGTVSGSPTPVGVAVQSSGDVNIPSVGDLVVIGRFKGRRPVIIGVLHSDNYPTRPYETDERHIGKDGNKLFFHGIFAAAPSVTEDPVNPPSSAVWYREDLGEYRGVENGTIVSFNTTAV